MLDTDVLCCPKCKGKLKILWKKIFNVRRGKHIEQKRRFLYCVKCAQGWRIQLVAWPTKDD